MFLPLQVEQLTHKLREYVVARFREAMLSAKPAVPCSAQCLQMHEMPADPGSTYIIAPAQMTELATCRSSMFFAGVSPTPRATRLGSVATPTSLQAMASRKAVLSLTTSIT